MKDKDASKWINQNWRVNQILPEKAVRGELSLVVVNNFLQENVAAELSLFLVEQVRYRNIFAVYTSDIQTKGVEKAEWYETNEQYRFYRFGRLESVSDSHRLSPELLTYFDFRKWLGSSDFLSTVSELTDIDLDSIGEFYANAFRKGDYLKPHDDQEPHRKLAFVLNLSPRWEKEYGGVLHFNLPNASEPLAVFPAYNSLVVFNTDTEIKHFVSTVTPDAGCRLRVSIGGWAKGL